MARGKPCPEQLNLSMGMMDVLSSSEDLSCEDGTDCRNYGVLEGIEECSQAAVEELSTVLQEELLRTVNYAQSFLPKEQQELIITAKVAPNMDKIKENAGKELSEKEVYDLIWSRIKEVNKKLTSYKAVKELEIKEGEFEKTSTMKIKRYKEINKK